MKFRKTIHALLATLALLGAASCTDEETDLGIGLVDGDTFYSGTVATLYPDGAWSEIEDSLRTDNSDYGIIGNLEDPIYGKATSVLYTQIALPTDAGSINFSDESMVIDSVVLSLVKERLYPDTAGVYNLRFEVRQLAEPLLSDSDYYSTSELPVDNSTLFFDSTLTVGITDTTIMLPLNESIHEVLRTTATADEFIRHTKGLRIRITEGTGMMSINFSARKTCLTAYYHYVRRESDGQTDTIKGNYVFLMGSGTTRFTRFTHDYAGTQVGADSVEGNSRLYLESMGGYATRLSFDRDIRRFHAEHPSATIHYAELRLPLASEASDMKPDMIVASTQDASGKWIGIADWISFTLSGYDGTYSTDDNHFRIRMPRHVQQMLRQGSDSGLMLQLDSRRSSACNTVINGIADTAIAPKIVFVYSE